jgi:hypothetical protein
VVILLDLAGAFGEKSGSSITKNNRKANASIH